MRQGKPRGRAQRKIAKLSPAMARQKLGQHFLAASGWRERIAETLGSRSDDVWVEIGAGHGEMTEHLARRARRVVAIEADAALVRRLHERAAEWPNVEILHADVLSTDLRALAGERFRVYGNLPYYITSPVLHHLFRFAGAIQTIHIIIQLEVAERIAAQTRRRAYGYLSTLCQYYARPEIAMRIPPGAFRPPPKVTSALVSMRLPGEGAQLSIANEAGFLKFLHDVFSQKRKTLRNNLRLKFRDECMTSALAECQLSGNARAEELTLAQFARLFERLREN
jgi:16S rRNA (adenine1518-N6/adenine1519-N6)-dimethyltransferase